MIFKDQNADIFDMSNRKYDMKNHLTNLSKLYKKCKKNFLIINLKVEPILFHAVIIKK